MTGAFLLILGMLLLWLAMSGKWARIVSTIKGAP